MICLDYVRINIIQNSQNIICRGMDGNILIRCVWKCKRPWAPLDKEDYYKKSSLVIKLWDSVMLAHG